MPGRRFTNPDPMPDVSRFRLHLSRADVDEVLHHTHWIANMKGFTSEFFHRRYRGWDLASMMAVFTAAGILVSDSKGSPFGGRCHWKMRTLHFGSHVDFLVEWDEDAEDDGLFHGAGNSTGAGSFSVEGSRIPLDDEEALTEFVISLLRPMAPSPRRPHDPTNSVEDEDEEPCERPDD